MKYSRKDFLKTFSYGMGAALLTPRRALRAFTDFPQSEKLGRIVEGMVEIKSKPDYDAQTVGTYYEDAVVPWLYETIGPWPFRNNQRWVETPDGFIWGPYVQPVRNIINPTVEVIPEGQKGFWSEVTVPWVNAEIENPPARSSWWSLQKYKNLPYRFYYSQILWVDDVQVRNDGKSWYRINERFGNPGDIFWVPGEALRPITKEEMAPIHPEAENKQIVVDVSSSRQLLSCYEGNTEVYFCRISSGKGDNSTPLSAYDSKGFHIWRKLYSIQMAGGTNQAGWMIPGIGYAIFFLGSGVAIHSTFWHNNFGEPSSHGCVNTAPEDAKWIFRWANPGTTYQEGDVTVSGTTGTPVKVIEY